MYCMLVMGKVTSDLTKQFWKNHSLFQALNQLGSLIHSSNFWTWDYPLPHFIISLKQLFSNFLKIKSYIKSHACNWLRLCCRFPKPKGSFKSVFCDKHIFSVIVLRIDNFSINVIYSVYKNRKQMP